MKLKVHHVPADEVYHDIARIPEEYRKDPEGERIERGVVCQLFCKDTAKKTFIVLYGSTRDGADISIDNRTRKNLDVRVDRSYDFELTRAGFFGEVFWALESGDVVHRFSSRLALLSFFLGVIGLALGIISIIESLHH